MSYREPAALAFSPRQLQWIAATTTERVVRSNLAGVATTTPRRASDRLERAAFVAGGALLAGGVYAFATTASVLFVVPGVVLLALGGARRRTRRRSLTEDFLMEVVTAAPRFAPRAAVSADGDEIVFTTVEIDGETMRWPAALDALAPTLAADERLRVGIARHGPFRSVAWAYPLLP